MKTKNILFRVKLEGQGIVNYDGDKQKWLLINEKTHLNDSNNNVMYAKKNYYRDSNNNLTYKIKISDVSIKKAMFSDNTVAHTPRLTMEKYLLYSYITSPEALIRGYLFAEKSELINGSIKRTGALTLTDAEQINNAVSHLEFFTKGGEKLNNDIKGDSDKSETSIYKKETVGHIEYFTSGSLSIKDLQFISCDQIYDRYSFNSDYFDVYESCMKMYFPNFNSKLGYYNLNTSKIDLPEHGILLSKEIINQLIVDTLSRLININIRRKASYAKTSSLQIKLVNDPLTDTLESVNGWISINSIDDINNLDIDPEIFYDENDKVASIEKRKDLEIKLKESKKESKEKDKEKDKEKNKKKNNK